MILSIDVLLYIGFTFFIASIPVENILPITYNKIRGVNNKLEKPHSLVFFSFATFIPFISYLLIFLKGYGLLFLCDYLFENEYLIAACILIILFCNNWSIFLKFKNKSSFFIILWGIYMFLDTPLGLSYPILYLLSILLLNSFEVGQLMSTVLIFFGIWKMDLDTFYLPINFFIFLILLYAYRHVLFGYLEHKPKTLLNSYMNRS
ncbi:MAG: hypothetical protein HRT90_00395 [Candidatus Margulisbacteria bacterium]|nr:hypothetical protein [Candidatus Margulisiibacteriota bacterium]